MKSTISRRTLIAGALSAPAILTLTRGAQAATNLTLGHNAAPGNPRSIATERFAELVKEGPAATSPFASQDPSSSATSSRCSRACEPAPSA